VRAGAKRLGRVCRENWLFLLILGAMITGFLVLRTSASSLSSVDEVDAILQNGRPALVEFYSNA
jgi:hypothetical protein